MRFLSVTARATSIPSCSGAEIENKVRNENVFLRQAGHYSLQQEGRQDCDQHRQSLRQQLCLPLAGVLPHQQTSLPSQVRVGAVSHIQ